MRIERCSLEDDDACTTLSDVKKNVTVMERPRCSRKAKDIVNESGSLPAAYHLARHFEAIGKTADAVSFYARSSRFNHAIRLAKDHGMDAEVRRGVGWGGGGVWGS